MGGGFIERCSDIGLTEGSVVGDRSHRLCTVLLVLQ
jgi:hypothetical protein